MTPLDIEILLHYHCSGSEFDRLDAPACRDAVDDFLREGILRERSDEENHTRAHHRMYEPTDRGRALVNALCMVPYPVQVWILPNWTGLEDKPFLL